MLLTGGQIRAARGFLDWSARELAQAANLGLSTVQRVEASVAITAANMDALRRTLEAAGIEFIPENGGGVGLRLRKSDP